ncbi:DUF4153 domain-containing protein [Ruegeria sp. HKCCD7255]|uniref:DUF4153 domain-containing protein n=1 Tax=Ruegeria sp. HKCCD7255 TaxID=2683004 RepID=UPI0014879C7B|nr:DUF4173 domain-containing protein [Ruegeria sp. HKCCD7255]
MQQTLTVHGVPDRVKMDAWWLDGADGPDQPPRDKGALLASLHARHAIVLLAILVTLADWLFWEQPIGVSMAVFMLTFSAAILAMKPKRPSSVEWVLAMGFAILCNLPLIIELQFLSVLFSLIGVVCLAVWAVRGQDLTGWRVIRAAARLSTIGATLLARAAIRWACAAEVGSSARKQAPTLVLPLMMGTVFIVLLTLANPLLEDFFEQLDPGILFDPVFWQRLFFWSFVASLIWPYLNLETALPNRAARAKIQPKAGPHRISYLINPGSVRNSLLLFNLLFLFQTGMDLIILSGGLTLPDGMTYASYAHRGAYPLVATALLAGGFVLVTHRMIAEDRIMRGLVYLWLAQNMILVVTAAIRLNLYVETYALTHLRVAAFIWMALVLSGLVLTVIQIHRGHDTGWLLRRNFVALTCTLYACCFVNFAGLIASYNLNHTNSLDHRDTYYLCNLGPNSFPAIHAYESEHDEQVCGAYWTERFTPKPVANWREWGFRNWRIRAYYQQNS